MWYRHNFWFITHILKWIRFTHSNDGGITTSCVATIKLIMYPKTNSHGDMRYCSNCVLTARLATMSFSQCPGQCAQNFKCDELKQVCNENVLRYALRQKYVSPLRSLHLKHLHATALYERNTRSVKTRKVTMLNTNVIHMDYQFQVLLVLQQVRLFSLLFACLYFIF